MLTLLDSNIQAHIKKYTIAVKKHTFSQNTKRYQKHKINKFYATQNNTNEPIQRKDLSRKIKMLPM